jgi:hypothetical protein
MAISRRNFLLFGQAIVATTALPAKFLGASNSPKFGGSKNLNLANMTRESFLPYVNSSFEVDAGPGKSAWFTLLSVDELKPTKTGATVPMAVPPKPARTYSPQIETYALRFLLTGEQLPQGTYTLNHRDLGQFDLFVAPAASMGTYTAVVSHILTSMSALPPPPVRQLKPAGAGALQSQ